MSRTYTNNVLAAYFSDSTTIGGGGDRSSGHLYMDGEDKLSYGDKGILLAKRYRPDCLEEPCYLIRSHTTNRGANRAIRKALEWIEWEQEDRDAYGKRLTNTLHRPCAVAAFPEDPVKSIARVAEKWDEIQGAIRKRKSEVQINRYLKWANNQLKHVRRMGEWFNIKTPVLRYNNETINFLVRARLDGKLEGTWMEVLGDD